MIIDLLSNWREDTTGCISGETPNFQTCTHKGVIQIDNPIYQKLVTKANTLKISFITGNPRVTQNQIDALSCMGKYFQSSVDKILIL